MKTRFLSLLAVAMVLFALAGSAAAQPKNIIIMIADGWGSEQIAATDYFTAGEAGAQVYHKDFASMAMSTYSAGGQGYDPEAAAADFAYLKSGATDSAAAATALSTGQKTTDGAIGVDPEGNPLEGMLHLAKKAGKKTGVVTSVQFSHATPAGFVAHSNSRGEYEGIARQMVMESPVDVIMGAGHPWFDEDSRLVAQIDEKGRIVTTGSYRYVGGADTWLALLAGTAGADANGDGEPNPWTLVQTRQEVLDAAANPPDRLFGLMQAATTLQKNRTGADADIKDDAPGATPLNTAVPTLGEMAAAALGVLAKGPDGFALMIEGGAVDWANHANEGGRMIEEMMDFNAAVEAVVAWIETHSNWDDTLLVVTGDHETGYVTGSADDSAFVPVENRGKGVMPGMAYHSDGHTNSLVPLFVKGSGADRFVAKAVNEDPRRGAYLDNTDVGQILCDLVGAN